MILTFAFTALLVLLLIVLCVILATRLYDQSQQVERLRRALYPVSLKSNWWSGGGRGNRPVWAGIVNARKLAYDAIGDWTPEAK